MDFENWDREAYCRRVRLLRELLGMNQTDFAAFVGLAYKKWHHYERGYPVSRETAFILHQKINWFSTDWLWFGDERALPGGIVEQMRDLERTKRKRLKPGKPLPKTPVPKRLSRVIQRQH